MAVPVENRAPGYQGVKSFADRRPSIRSAFIAGVRAQAVELPALSSRGPEIGEDVEQESNCAN